MKFPGERLVSFHHLQLSMECLPSIVQYQRSTSKWVCAHFNLGLMLGPRNNCGSHCDLESTPCSQTCKPNALNSELSHTIPLWLMRISSHKWSLIRLEGLIRVTHLIQLCPLPNLLLRLEHDSGGAIKPLLLIDWKSRIEGHRSRKSCRMVRKLPTGVPQKMTLKKL